MRFDQLNIPAVALLGISLSPFLFSLFQKASQVILLLDGDRAGRLATAKLGETLKQYCSGIYRGAWNRTVIKHH